MENVLRQEKSSYEIQDEESRMTSGDWRQLGITRVQNVGQKSGKYEHKLSTHLIVLCIL